MKTVMDNSLLELRSLKKKGARAAQVTAHIIGIVGEFVRLTKLGKVFDPSCEFKIWPDHANPSMTFSMSFLARGRLPEDKTPTSYITIAPDLSCEVISPFDLAEEEEDKRLSVLQAGTRLVWLFFPGLQTVHVYRLDGSCSVLGPDAELNGEDVLPGFVCKVAEFFAEN